MAGQEGNKTRDGERRHFKMPTERGWWGAKNQGKRRQKCNLTD